jgi:hypothetical protein
LGSFLGRIFTSWRPGFSHFHKAQNYAWVPREAASATSPREKVSYFRKTGGEKRNRFGRVFEFKSTVFGRFETATRPRYAPQKLHSRVALLEKVH